MALKGDKNQEKAQVGAVESNEVAPKGKGSKDKSANVEVIKRGEELIAQMSEEERSQIGAKSATISLTLTSTNSDVTPIIDLQRASLNMINNLIDKQDSDRSTSGFNTPLVFVNETQADGGSHVAIHKTVPVTLVETAVGLRILLAANRPADADFLVYWRTADEGTNIRNVNWNLVQSENVVPSDENPSVFREYRYLVGGPGGSLTPFTTYQVKIVFRSINSSKVPAIKDLRVIAMAT